MRQIPTEMPDIDILIEDERWQELGIGTLAQRACDVALRHAFVSTDVEISILAADDKRIAELNQAHRGKSGPTNVLSWPAEDLAPPVAGQKPAEPTLAELGDIAIAYETCAKQASDGGVKLADHVTHLIIHGCLHLLGYDHETDADATLMESLEIKALESMGLHNPYL